MNTLLCVFAALFTPNSIFSIEKVSGTTDNGINGTLLETINSTRKLLGDRIKMVENVKTDLFRKIKTVDIAKEIKDIPDVKQLHSELLNTSSNLVNKTQQYQLDHCHTLFDYGLFRLDAQLRVGLLRIALFHALTPLDGWGLTNYKLLDEMEQNYGYSPGEELFKCETDQQSKKTLFCRSYLYNMHRLNSLNNYLNRQHFNADSVIDKVRPLLFERDWSEMVNEVLGDPLRKCIYKFPIKTGIFALYPPSWKLAHCDIAKKDLHA